MFAQLTKGVHKCMKCQESGQGQPHPLFIATQANKAIGPLELLSARSPNMPMPGTEHGSDLLNGQIPMASWGTRHGGGGTTPEVVVTT